MEMLRRSDMVQEAIRLSAEALAMADAALRQHDAATFDSRAADFTVAAKTQTDMLAVAGMTSDAFSCGIMACCTADIVGMTRCCLSSFYMIPMLTSVMMSGTMAIDTLPHNDETVDRGRNLFKLLATLAVYYVDRLNQTGTAGVEAALASLTDECRQFIDALSRQMQVDKAGAEIDGAVVDPAHTKAYLAEILSEASLLGILVVN